MAKKGGLGRGLDTIIPKPVKPVSEETETTETSESTEAKEAQEETKIEPKEGASAPKEVPMKSGEQLLNINLIEPKTNQPRKQFDEDSLQELSLSITQYGVLQPILVSKKGEYYQIIAGERRWRAAKLSGLKEVPVLIREYSTSEEYEISLIENLQREDLNPIEEAQAFQTIISENGLTQEQLSTRLSVSRSYIANSVRLLKLNDRVQEMLINEMITVGHAKVILTLEDKTLQQEVATKVFDNNLSVKQTEALVKRLTSDKGEGKEKVKNEVEEALYQNIEKQITDIIGTKVLIQRKKNDKGKIQIEYYSREDLDRIIELLESIGS